MLAQNLVKLHYPCAVVVESVGARFPFLVIDGSQERVHALGFGVTEQLAWEDAADYVLVLNL